MSYSELSSQDLLQHLKAGDGGQGGDGIDHEFLEEIARRANDASADQTFRDEVHAFFGDALRERPWANCIGKQKCYPASYQFPKSKDDLLAAVKTAKNRGLTVRAVGSGHSFSNVCETNGIMLNPKYMTKVLPLDSASLKDPSQATGFFAVESGITIKALNDRLDERGLALENMGSYNGQTLAGAISTGTHGTGVSLGPIASSVMALTLVASDGTVYQIEPTNGITDPTKFSVSNVVLKQDDEWFNTVLISTGCTGLIYSYILKVVPSFYLREIRSIKTWEGLKSDLSKGASSPVLAAHHGYELQISPYPINGTHTCIQILHDTTTATKRSGWRGVKNWLNGLLARIPLAEHLVVGYMNWKPHEIPGLINNALKSLETPNQKNGYVNKSYEVMNIGAVVAHIKAYALELSLPCDENLVANVDALLDFLNQTVQSKGGYLTGPVVLRFVAPSSAYIAPQTGRTTRMVELDMLLGIDKAESLMKAVKNKMCTPGNGIRLHWGLDPEDSISPKDVADWYPDLPKWKAVYQTLNADGMWNNALTERLGISVKKAK